MDTYKLDQHLKELCNQNERYLNLYSTWTLNKRTCSDLLKNVVIHYPHFSMHDASHADTVLSRIEMLLGPRVHHLSPTDTWLILHAAYTHDLGMVVEWKSIEAKWSEKDFQDTLSYLETLQDEDLYNAIQFVRATHDLTKEHFWPLEASRYVRLINAALFRGKHARMSKEYIDFTAPELGLDIGHNRLIPPRLVKLLGRICQLHTEPLDNVMELDYQTNGFDSDYAHPRFVAMMLRLGDLLDIDNGRFNVGTEAVSGDLPSTSKPHREKHEATTHLLVTPKEICFRSDCPNSTAYLEARHFVSWLEKEIDFLTKNWSKISPEHLGGYAPYFDEKELLINGVPDIEGVADLRFQISQDKAFSIIEGSYIYRTSMVFLREVLQNAIDASKIQLWRDLCSDTYLAWLGSMDEDSLMMIQPYEIPKEVYKNYPIYVNLSAIDAERVRIEITDRGTGISVESFKRMCNVGESSESSIELRNILKKMPNWLRPTAGFGIGLQSIFLVADQFTIDTSTGQDAFHAVVYSKRKGGYLQLQTLNTPRPRGTTICIETSKLYQFTRGAHYALEATSDPLSGDSPINEMAVLGEVDKLTNNSIFPHHILCKNLSVNITKEVSTFPLIDQEGWEWWQGRYRYKLAPNGEKVSLWDTQEAVLEELIFRSETDVKDGIWFKGFKTEKPSFCWPGEAWSYMDIYGLDSKAVLTLDRTNFTEEGSKKVLEIEANNIHVIRDIILQKIQSPSYKLGKYFDIFGFWLLCGELSEKIPPELVQQISDEVNAFEKNEHGKFQVVKKPARELIPMVDQMAYIDIIEVFSSSFNNRATSFFTRQSSSEWACSKLNTEKEITQDLFISGGSFNFALKRRYFIQSLYMLQEGNRSLMCYTLQPHQTPINVPPSIRSKILLGLRSTIPGVEYEATVSARYATFALEEYDAIAVREVPDRMPKPVDLNSAWMIAPFSHQDDENCAKFHWSKEFFVAQVTGSTAFDQVINWVMSHSIRKIPPLRDEIVKGYRMLLNDYYEVAMSENKPGNEQHDTQN